MLLLMMRRKRVKRMMMINGRTRSWSGRSKDEYE